MDRRQQIRKAYVEALVSATQDGQGGQPDRAPVSGPGTRQHWTVSLSLAEVASPYPLQESHTLPESCQR